MNRSEKERGVVIERYIGEGKNDLMDLMQLQFSTLKQTDTDTHMQYRQEK